MKLKLLLYCDSYGERVGQGMDYMDFFSKFGEVILVGPDNSVETFVELGDVLVLPGGADVDPARYHERPYYKTSRVNAGYEHLDTHLLPAWLETGKPIIGVCRGLQTLNVALGGSLIQDLVGHVGDGEKRWKDHHEIYTDIDGYKVYHVNSFHHQGIKRLGEGLRMLGWGALKNNCPSLRYARDLQVSHTWDLISGKNQVPRYEKTKGRNKEEGQFYVVPEIIEGVDRPIIAFQYHPESSNDELAILLIDKMLKEFFGDKYEIDFEEPVDENPYKLVK